MTTSSHSRVLLQRFNTSSVGAPFYLFVLRYLLEETFVHAVFLAIHHSPKHVLFNELSLRTQRQWLRHLTLYKFSVLLCIDFLLVKLLFLLLLYECFAILDLLYISSVLLEYVVLLLLLY